MFKRLNPATTNEFTEAQKIISTSKGFSSRLEENFPALTYLALPSEQNLKDYSEQVVLSCLEKLVTTSNVYMHSDNAAL